MNRCRAAHDLMHQTTIEEEADIAILAEPNQAKVKEGYVRDQDGGDVAIWLGKEAGKHVKGQGNGGKGIVWVQLGEIRVVACYISPNSSKEEFEGWLSRLEDQARGRKKIVVAGDVNAKSRSWGSPTTDLRGARV